MRRARTFMTVEKCVFFSCELLKFSFTSYIVCVCARRFSLYSCVVGSCFFFLLFRIMYETQKTWRRAHARACVLSIKKIEKIYIPCEFFFSLLCADHHARAYTKQTRDIIPPHIFMSVRSRPHAPAQPPISLLIWLT